MFLLKLPEIFSLSSPASLPKHIFRIFPESVGTFLPLHRWLRKNFKSVGALTVVITFLDSKFRTPHLWTRKKSKSVTPLSRIYALFCQSVAPYCVSTDFFAQMSPSRVYTPFFIKVSHPSLRIYPFFCKSVGTTKRKSHLPPVDWRWLSNARMQWSAVPHWIYYDLITTDYCDNGVVTANW